MRNLLCLVLPAAVALFGCGGNVNVDGSGGTGGGTGGASSSSSSNSTSSSSSSQTAGLYDACDGPGQCVLAVPGCCDPCGLPELGELVPVNLAKLAAYKNAVCPEPTPCPACVSQLNPNLFAYCDAGKCVAADVRTDAVSACTTDAECHLRAGSECCEACFIEGASQVIAVSSNASPQLPALVCAPSTGCDECAPQYPPNMFASCNAGGHCSAIITK